MFGKEAKRQNIISGTLRMKMSKTLEVFKKEYMKRSVKKPVKMGMLPLRTWGFRALGMPSSEKQTVCRADEKNDTPRRYVQLPD